jgi:hypothetical protein
MRPCAGMLAVGRMWTFASILLLLHSCGLTAAQQPRLQQAANGMYIVLGFFILIKHIKVFSNVHNVLVLQR